ncbi:MAG: caspase family protein, partial [Spirochaetota bacterium]|nr:caspase family protein [Spirochaetota bacterium]
MKKLIVIFLLTISSISFAINNIDTFKKFKKPKMRVLLIANQDYDGKDMDLSFTINDMTIYKTIFKELLGVPKGNITFIKNLSSGNFDETMKDFIEDIDKDDLVVIIYAGHGSTNGMPVLTDKKTISVNDFHKHFNSFKNDTILIMDSCYSGAEGEISSQSQSGADGGRGVGVVKKTGITIIKDKDVDEKHTFRENVVRIYSSLAHQESREGK